MSVIHVNGHPASGYAHGDGRRGALDAYGRLRAGNEVDVRVLRKLSPSAYIVSLAEGQHVMDSTVPMDVGDRVRAVVVTVGDKLELRYLGAGQAAPVAETEGEDDAGADTGGTGGSPGALVANLEARYHLNLRDDERAVLQRAAGVAADPTAMVLGGLYLSKQGQPVTQDTLDALHAAQQNASASPAVMTRAPDVSSLVERAAQGDEQDVATLAALIGGAMGAGSEAAGGKPFDGSDSSSDREPSRDSLAQQLLNLQDGGTVGYRYGTLPVIVADQLVELDLVVLQQRPNSQGSPGVRRLVMSLQTKSFGEVRVEARALENRLIVSFNGESADSARELSAYRDEVKGLVGRLGWNVEAIGYETGESPGSAARAVIDHVLSAGTIDQVL